MHAQELPPIEVYQPDTYGAENQNWGISQSKDKYIYVANNSGLLEFNGAEWTLYESPNGIMRSVKVIEDLIYTGSYREFGYWKKNDFGKLIYHSLSKQLKIDFLEDEEFWNIISIDDYILFQSFKGIYIYNTSSNSYSKIVSDDIIYKIFKVDESIYYQKEKNGIYVIESGESKLISNHQIIKDNLLVNIYKYDETLLVETENNGFYILENNDLIKWNIPASEMLSNLSVYRSVKLKDGSFVLGTRSNGVVHLTESGKVSNLINTELGLSNNTIHYVFEDAESNIWFALDNGINCINIKSPFTIFNDKEGFLGTIYTSAIYDDYLYLGTNQGLFSKPLNSNSKFKFIENTQGPVWNLKLINNTLFSCHDNGTFIIKNNEADLVIDERGTWDIKPILNSPNLLLQGNYGGLNVVEKVDNTFQIRNKIKDFYISSRFFEIYDNTIFISHENRGVYKIIIDDNFKKVNQITKDTIVKKGLKSSLVNYNNTIIYSSKDGVYSYNKNSKSFTKDTILNKLYTKETYISGKLIVDSTNTILWNFSKNNLNYITTSKFINKPEINKIPYSKALPKGLTGYENISYIKDNQHLIGTSKGYIVLDLDKIKNKKHEININAIMNNSIENESVLVNKSITEDFDFKHNNITFSYNVAEFSKYLDVQYQYRLEGLYSEWSEWSENSKKVFQNLPHGDYTFYVRAKIGNTLSQNIASYSFGIQRPWYLSKSIFIAYALLVLLFSLFMHNVYKQYYKKQRERILQKTTQELELKELENKQQLMRFNNEKLRQDIENKNRELGISTMSLIKRNEFLNQIKKELISVDDSKQLKRVIKIIDQNLNNNDDWHLFEEAFNNADKDFLKKVKTLHPELTSNDLRLCAYLRLNLSSKEIAPLLNISSRSVEVKRYRLRKKMNLAHESSLSDYILEI
tara:strand:- start:19455 stop:22202 length:2748 start_codon:yes stop_codon:yes gene_type:complete